MRGRIIIVNGPSSSGKSTVIQQMRKSLVEPFCYFSVDLFTDGKFHPITPVLRDHSVGEEIRRFMRGFHRSIASFAEAGNDIIVEHVLERQEFADDLAAVVDPFDVFWVGVTASLDELERRERDRGDRDRGTAALFINTIDFCKNDIVVDTTSGTSDPAEEIVLGWQRRAVP